jgi:L-ascorbate metabolism protein UlaG (beta-lactamase superfamily)
MHTLALLVRLLLILAVALVPGTAPAQAGGAASVIERITLNEGTAGADMAAPGSVQFIGTATVLIRYMGITILTDPNFLHKGDKVHLGYGLHAERLTEPALELAQLPPIDLVVLSHFHEDHFDKLVQQQLDRNTLIVSTRHAAARLKQLGFRRALALSRFEAIELRRGAARLTVTAMPGRHGPPLAAALLPPVMGSMLDFSGPEARQRYRMYISGDTLVYEDIALIPHRFPGIDLAVLHLGGTRILKVLKVTMDGQDGVEMLNIVAPAHAIPIHYDDYDVFKSPLSEFAAAVRAAGLENKVSYLQRGQTYTFRKPP